MKIRLPILGVLAALTVGCASTPAPAPASTSAPGLEPYTPTKLEWLQVEAQTELSENARCYSTNITKREPDTIVVVVAYKKCLDEAAARMAAKQDVGAVGILAERHGWKSWVKVESDVHLLNGNGLD